MTTTTTTTRPIAVSIVVPMYNERDNAPAVVAELLGWARANLAAFEVIAVDDGSRDGTAEALPSAPELRLLRHARNQGLTASLRTGFAAARLELVTWLPADGQIEPSAIGALVDAWGGEAMVLSTYHHRPDGAWRALMSRTARLLLLVLLGLRDRLEGIYLFRRAVLDDIALVSTRSAGIVAFELAAKIRRRGLPIASTRIACLPRRSGRSKVADARNIADFVAELLVIRRSM